MSAASPCGRRVALKRVIGDRSYGYGIPGETHLPRLDTKLGRLQNRIVHSADAAPWTYGTAALMRNLVKRKLI